MPATASTTVVVADLYGVATDDKQFYSRAPEGAPIVALCVPQNPPDLLSALQGGVRALISRESDTPELMLAIRIARRGGLYVTPELHDPLVDTTRNSDRGPHELTPREAEALRYLAEGFTHGQIGRRMGLAETTVNTYVKRIRHKLNAGNKAELTRRAMELGYLQP
ncbi:response regulator transcription factor [Actinoplanes sp. NPDC048796]|uniref:response regulator transcription factor n=1 Tax=Actinoplanes sp. NPDC048796 TaxID=3155640 RepID=UPI0033CDFD85